MVVLLAVEETVDVDELEFLVVTLDMKDEYVVLVVVLGCAEVLV